MAITSLFASKSLAEHAIRGTIGMAALYGATWSLTLAGTPALCATIAFVGISLIALRGCPFCWSIGLINTVLINTVESKSCKACTDLTLTKA